MINSASVGLPHMVNERVRFVCLVHVLGGPAVVYFEWFPKSVRRRLAESEKD